MNNETVGISAELAIADTFDIEVSPLYRVRGDEDIADSISVIIEDVFEQSNIPLPVEHIAENQNPIDFILGNDQTLSVKSNQQRLGLVAPQVIGQPTSETYFAFLQDEFGFDVNRELRRLRLSDTYESRAYIFKCFSMDNICTMLDVYWQYMFHCDHYLHFYNVLDRFGGLTNNPRCIVLRDLPEHVRWDPNLISFTQTVNTWGECNTLRYNRISIGQFQVHRNRNCLKFRFNIAGILKLIDRGLI